MEIEEGKIFTFVVEVHDDLFDCVNWGMIFGGWIDIASVEVYPIRIDSVVSPSNSIGIEDGEEIKDKFVSQKPGLLGILSKSSYNSCHDMRTGYLPWVNSGSDDDTFFFLSEFSRLIFVWEEILILKLLIFIGDIFFGSDGEKVYWSSFE